MFENSTPILVGSIKGLYNRGDANECPPNHLSDTLNTKFDKGVGSRDGFDRDMTVPFPILRMAYYTRIGEATRTLVLDNNGQIFDASMSLVTPILTISGMTDFSICNFSNRCFITPHNKVEGKSGQFVWIYDGSICRMALGNAPQESGLSVAQSATAGHVDAGIHLIALAYEYNSGFITKPGPAAWKQITVDGSHKIAVNNIPTGAGEGRVGVVARHILATKSVQATVYDGNQLGQELFFAHKINDDTTPSYELDFYDADLQDSADYLIDQLETLKACLKLFPYQGRLCAANFDGENNLIRVSKVREPESFDSIDGVILVDPYSSGGVQNGIEYRGQILISKDMGFYYTQDNGDTPSTWNVSSLDKGVATTVFGLSSILDLEGTNADRIFVCDRAGLLMFNGIFNKPPLTYEIDNIWRRINPAAFNTIQIADDVIGQKIYIAVPLDNATSPSHIIYGDYNDGITDHTSIKWSIWQMARNPTSIGIDMVNNVPIFKYGSSGDNTYKLEENRHNDDLVAFDSFAKFALLSPGGTTALYQFNGIQVRASGSGNLDVELTTLDGVGPVHPQSLALALGTGLTMDRLINYVAEQCSVKLSVNSYGEWFQILYMTLYGDLLWYRRPA